MTSTRSLCMLAALLLLVEASPARAAAPTTRGAAAATARATRQRAPVPPPAPAPPRPFDPLTDTSHGVIGFERDLGLDGGFTLAGHRTQRAVDFAIPHGWEVTSDPELHLDLAHSAALDPDKSRLAVLLNGQSVASVRLDETTRDGQTLHLRLPRALLQPFNHLTFDVIHDPGTECVDPLDPALWSRIGPASSVSVPHRDRAVSEGLEAWPLPFVDTRDYGAVVVTPVLPTAPSVATTRTAGALAVTLGRLATYRGVEVHDAARSLAEVHSAALLVGLPAELGDLAPLLGTVPALAPGEGLVALVPNPHDVRLPVLVVSGADEAGLEKAAVAVARQSSAPVMQGRVAVVRDAAPASAPARTEVPRPFPAGEVATLEALGYDDITVRGQGAGNVRLKVMLEGDAVVTPKGGRLTLNYAYPAQLDNRLSAMEVRVGGVSVRSAPLHDPAGSAFSTLDVDVPETLLGVDTTVDVVFHLFPRDYDPCSWYADTQIWATLFDSSSVTLPRDHLAQMPDLGRLVHRGWPYTLEGAEHAVSVALPEAPSPQAWSTGLALVATLARWSSAADPQVSLALGSTVPVDDSTRGHVIVLADSTANAAVDALSARNLLALRGGPDELALMLGTNVLERVGSTLPTDTIEQVTFGRGHSALVLRANSERGFRHLLRTLTERGRTEKLFGSAAVVGEDEVRPVDTQRALAAWGTLPLSTQAQRLVQRDWWTLGVLVLVGAVATMAGFRRLARRREGGKA